MYRAATTHEVSALKEIQVPLAVTRALNPAMPGAATETFTSYKL